MFFAPLLPAARARRRRARIVYKACVDQSRQPFFYARLAVPDTFDGRFELTVLHTGLVVARLADPAAGRAGELLAQAVFDDMFVNMDRTCREIGVGDLSVRKHIKRMMKALKGRTLVYKQAQAQGPDALADALARNLYGTVPRPADAVLAAMATYLVTLEGALRGQTYAALDAGQIVFPLPSLQDLPHDDQTQAA